MALRLIERVVPAQDGEQVFDLLKDHKLHEHRQIRLSDGEMLVRILLDAKQDETVLDLLGERYAGKEGNLVILAVEATLPRDEPKPIQAPEQAKPEEKSPQRISREELYEDSKDAAQYSRLYLTMVVVSIILATARLYYDSVVIIGAVVMTFLLGPNMALSLDTTLGDLSLLRRAINRPHTAFSKELTMSGIRP